MVTSILESRAWRGVFKALGPTGRGVRREQLEKRDVGKSRIWPTVGGKVNWDGPCGNSTEVGSSKNEKPNRHRM